MSFIHEDFLLQSESARRLFHEYAESEPILDYHTHLAPDVIARNEPFVDLAELWLDGDHYKWRAMRANGIDESLITGDTAPYEKFVAWASTVPHTLRNPLYHWTHLELKRFFNIDTLLNESTAKSVWEQVTERLQSREYCPRSIFARFDVRGVCTTDDPADDLDNHLQIASQRESDEFETVVLPTFRPDEALRVDRPRQWSAWLRRLSKAADVEIENLSGLLDALRKRHNAFHDVGARVSDHGLEHCFARVCDETTASSIFAKARAGQAADRLETELFGSYLMVFFGQLDVDRGWAKQLHIGPLRNPSAIRMAALGVDQGFDTIGDARQGKSLASMLNHMESHHALPKTILYNINPADNYLFASMAGSFQGGNIPGKIQFGSAWWFLDQKEGIEWQLNAISNVGLLSRFIGMLTDSRSFMSLPRHEYFRRVLCDLLGRDMEQGTLPGEFELVGDLARRVCYQNACDYLGLP